MAKNYTIPRKKSSESKLKHYMRPKNKKKKKLSP